jgi:predicted ATPase/class 3 adenylate cyclase/Tfp pilus assembly protein PilF
MMTTLPTGTITFLFTDIESSTKQWECFPERMGQALARHDAILHRAIAEHNGQVIKKTGDGFHAAFTGASEALAAVVSAQLALCDEPWPEPVRITARMALHTGDAQLRDGDYYGPPLNRAARLMSIGHGGQILLSGATYSLIAPPLPIGISFNDLGCHRLKDLQHPETVWQVLHPDLPADFPPLRSLTPVRTNLPIQLTSFIGRQTEMRQALELLGRTRLLTLQGSGGTGKTRLALEIGVDRIDDYPDGVWLVELAPLTDGALIAQTVALALGVMEEPSRAIVDTLTGFLSSKRLLLILDNCEHLIDACGQLAEDLLPRCPQLKIVATSREPLRVTGEQTYRVPSLLTPDPVQLPAFESGLPASLLEYDAVRLFVERARQVRSDFELSLSNAREVASICHRLDGIPLAIELASARVRALSIDQINRRLDQRFHLLTGGNRSVLPRQQTLQALIDWSYELLTPRERTLLLRLSVFAGGCSLEAAERVCSDAGDLDAKPRQADDSGDAIEEWEVLDLLTSLVDKSLLLFEEREAEPRYRMLETIREYAHQKRGSQEGSLAIERRHRDWYLALAEEAKSQLIGRDMAAWLDRLEREHDNFRVALAWSLKNHEEGAAPALRLCTGLARFWWTRGHLTEGLHWCVAALGAEETSRPGEARAYALSAAGGLARMKSELTASLHYYQEALAIWRETGNEEGVGGVLNNLGLLTFQQGDFGTAKDYLEKSLTMHRRTKDRHGIVNAINNLGLTHLGMGGYAAAQSCFKESLALAREIEDLTGIAFALHNLGHTAQSRFDHAAAQSYLEQSLEVLHRIGDRQSIATCLDSLGGAARIRGDYATARSYMDQSLTIRRELGDQQGIANSLIHLGIVAGSEADYAAARTCFEQSVELFRSIGNWRATASPLCNLGNVAAHQGDYAAAQDYLEQGLNLYREMGQRVGIADVTGNLGGVALAQGEIAAARRHYQESLTIAIECDARSNIASSLTGFASLAAAEGAPERAAQLWGAAEALREAIQAPMSLHDRPTYERDISAVRQTLGAETFETAWAIGRAMSAEQAAARAFERD